MWPWRVKMPTQNLLRLLLLLMLILRNVLTTVWCRVGSWSLAIKLDFCSDYEHKVWSWYRSWSWSWSEILQRKFGKYFAADVWLRLRSSILVKILKPKCWCLVEILKLMLGRDSEDEIWSRFGFELVIWTQPSALAMFCNITNTPMPIGW